MRIGAVFPQTEIGSDPAGVRAYVQAVEAMGFSHLVVYDHVLGADPATRPGWKGYTASDAFHEPFVLYGFLAALTWRIELVTGVIILPQRQTVLVAKQAAELDVLSGGRLRLGIGVGWNPVEFEGLGEDFSTRGARSEEQIAVLRALWRDPIVTYHGRWHQIEAAGLNPLPPRRDIPIWLGGRQDVTLRRVARLADGWLPQGRPDDDARAAIERLRGYVEQAGRPPKAVGIEARLDVRAVPEAEWRAFADGWSDLGATYLGINTMGLGLAGPDAHLERLRQVKDALIPAESQPAQPQPQPQPQPRIAGAGQGRFDKLNERARQVLSLAQEEAQRFNHNYIGTEHLLLGLIAVREGVASAVLARLGVNRDRVRSGVEFILGRGDRIVLGEIGLTPRSKKVIELAVDESRRMGHHYIGTEHLLLGLIREGEGIAAGVLESLGLRLETVRQATIEVLRERGESGTS